MSQTNHTLQLPSLKVSRTIIAGQGTAVLAVILLATLFGFIVALESATLLAFALIPFLAVWALARPRLAVILFYISVFIPFGYLHRYFFSVPVAALWLPHLLLLFAVVSKLLSHEHKQQTGTVKWPKLIAWGGILWLAITIISLVANNAAIVPALLSLRWLYLILGSVFLHRLHFSSVDQQSLIKVLVWLGLAMLPVTIFQRLVIAPRYATPDMVTGLFSGYSELLFFQIVCILIVASWWIHGKRILPWPPAVTLLLLFTPLVISNSKAAPFYLVLTIVSLFYFSQAKISFRMIRVFLLLLLLIGAGTLIFDRVWQASYGKDSLFQGYYDLPVMQDYLFGDAHDRSSQLTKGGYLRRGANVVFNYNLIEQTPLTLLIGLGPGAVSESRLPGGSGHIYNKYPDLGLDTNSLAVVIGELGLLGLLLFAFILFGFYKLKDIGESGELLAVRKSTVCLLALLLIYGPSLIWVSVALVLGVLSIQPLPASIGTDPQTEQNTE